MKKGTAPFSIGRNGYHISWDAIPAWVCEQCGESLLETQEVDTIQETLAVLDRNTVSLVAHFLKKRINFHSEKLHQRIL
jgi:YgiT-type zinc finger domain-containing protein